MMTKAQPDDKPQHTIAMPDLQFMEVDFLKPTCRNPKARAREDEIDIARAQAKPS